MADIPKGTESGDETQTSKDEALKQEARAAWNSTRTWLETADDDEKAYADWLKAQPAIRVARA